MMEVVNMRKYIARVSGDGRAVGVNIVKTAEMAGMHLRFPEQGHPELMALLLID